MNNLYSLLVELSSAVSTAAEDFFSGEGSVDIDLASYANALALALARETADRQEFGGRPDKNLHLLVGGQFAAAIHLACHSAYANRTGGDDGVALALSVAETTDHIVSGYHLAARHGRSELAFYHLQNLLGSHVPVLTGALQSLGEPTAAQEHAAHATLCNEAKRSAMLAAAGLLLVYRLADRRLSASTPELAERREIILADRIDTGSAIGTFLGTDPLERIVFAGGVADGKLIDRPEKPYTQLVTGDNEQLRVHYKNTIWLGVAENQSVIARCKVEEPDNGIHYAVAEFEGPTTTADNVWESWLQNEVRSHYDLTPESIHWWTSFPDPASTLATLCYVAHVAGRN